MSNNNQLIGRLKSVSIDQKMVAKTMWNMMIWSASTYLAILWLSGAEELFQEDYKKWWCYPLVDAPSNYDYLIFSVRPSSGLTATNS